MSSEIIIIPKQELDAMRSDIARMSDTLKEIQRVVTRDRDAYLTTEQACGKYKVSEGTLFNRERKGLLKSWRNGRIVRWPESELDKFFIKLK